MAEKKLIGITKIIGFDGFENVEPKDLISFSKEYRDYQKEVLIPNLKRMKGMITTIVIIRMEHHGTWGKVESTGTVGLVEEDKGFIFTTDTDYYGEYSETREMFIQFDNVLGDVPMMLNAPEELNPFEVDSSETLNVYFQSLENMKDILRECVGKIHTAKLFFRYDEYHPNFRQNNFIVECEILKQNKSNVEIYHKRTCSFGGESDSCIDLIPGERFYKFVSPECYLYKVMVHLGTECKINPYDED